MTSYLIEKYSYILNDYADPRVKNWIGFSNPGIALSVVAVYLLSIYVFLPAYMKNRKPYSLKTFLYGYNVFQIVYCLGLIYTALTSGLTWVCQPVDYSTNPKALAALNCVYYTYILKGIELIETAVFVLRKKYNQVSKLHVYHHISTFLLCWIGVKFVGGGMSTFPIAVNSGIHILMYIYYLLTSFGEEWRKKLEIWKPRLTMLQMIQFCVLIVHSLQTMHPDCSKMRVFLTLYIPDVFVVFYMFWDFYQQNYKGEKKKN